ncbi:hypothetical protein OC842_004913 [Tilletia horrida]|uniref:Uncharacterized protein n=1 Tax=Tilletia horrida TaxID=155126 RepID=A0AAN6G8Y7_9BASI|nr:hypothetical protein OC842_004913 [Tilletia horrida]
MSSSDAYNALGTGVQTILTVRYFAVAIATVTCWEHLLHAPQDVRVLRRLLSKKQIQFSDLILLIVRYALLWYITVGLLFWFGRSDACSALKVGIYLSTLIGSTALNVLFLTRVWLLWNRAKWVIAVLGICLLADSVIWITIAVEWRAMSVKQYIPAPGPACLFSPNQFDWHGQNWLPRILFEGLACVLTLWRLYTLPKLPGHGPAARRGRRLNDMRSWFRNSNLIYFGSTFAIYMTGIVGGRLYHEQAAPIIWIVTAQVFPLMIGVRIILATPSRRVEERERKLPKHSKVTVVNESDLPPPAPNAGSSSFFSTLRTLRGASASTAGGWHSAKDGMTRSHHSLRESGGAIRNPQPKSHFGSIQLPAPALDRSVSRSVYKLELGLSLGLGLSINSEKYNNDISPSPSADSSRPTTIHSQSFSTPDGWLCESAGAGGERGAASPAWEEEEEEIGGVKGEGEQRRTRRMQLSAVSRGDAEGEARAHRPL